MSKLTLNNIGSLLDATTAASTLNSNSAATIVAIENTLSRDGTSPNQMGSTLDMNSNQVVNLPQPATANSPLRLQDLDDFLAGGTITNIPSGGTTGQKLQKSSNTNYAVEWGSSLNSISSPNSTLAITSGSTTATADVDLTHANTWTGVQTINSPVLVTPALGTPVSGTLTSCTGLPISTGVSGLGTSVSTFLATPTSANLASALTDETGSGSTVFATSPTLVTPILGTPTSATLTNATGLPVSTGISGLGTGVATFLATPSSANLAAAITDETGSGAVVFATSPTLVTPILGTPTSGTLTNATGLPISTGVSGLATGVATFLATPNSANLAAAMTDETGTGANVFATSPTLVTPILGTPTSGTLTNATGLPVSTGISGLGTGVATFLATPTSANLAAAITDETGSGANVFATSPTLVTPVLGVATATSINGNAWTTGTGTLTQAASSTLTTTTTTSIGRGQYQGTNTNDSATAGNIGEAVTASLASGSAVSLSTGVANNITTISLTAGDWDVHGSIIVQGAATTVTSLVGGAINTVSATFPSVGEGYFTMSTGSITNGTWLMPTGTVRLSLSGTTTVYLIAQMNFTTSTATGYGQINARRIR